jgi:hypothetical protein
MISTSAQARGKLALLVLSLFVLAAGCHASVRLPAISKGWVGGPDYVRYADFSKVPESFAPDGKLNVMAIWGGPSVSLHTNVVIIYFVPIAPVGATAEMDAQQARIWKHFLARTGHSHGVAVLVIRGLDRAHNMGYNYVYVKQGERWSRLPESDEKTLTQIEMADI